MTEAELPDLLGRVLVGLRSATRQRSMPNASAYLVGKEIPGERLDRAVVGAALEDPRRGGFAVRAPSDAGCPVPRRYRPS